MAEQLGTEPVTFPGGHNGFRSDEHGSMGEPDAFAATLRKVLSKPAPEPSRAHRSSA